MKGNKREKGKDDKMKIGTEGKIFKIHLFPAIFSKIEKTEVQTLKLISLNTLTDNSSH